DIFIKTVDFQHFLHGYVSNLLQRGKAFVDQDLSQLFIYIQLIEEIAQHITGLGFLFCANIVFGHDIESPAGQLTGQPDVLATTADCLGEVILSHGDIYGVRVFIQNDRGHFGGRHGVDHELGQVVIPEHDIHTLTAQLAGHCLNTRTAHADTSTLRINALVFRAHRNLGPGARITGSAHDFDQLFGNLRHFDTEQFDDHFRAAARQYQLRSAILDADILEQRADAGAGAEGFTRDHFLARQYRFGIVAQVHDDTVTSNFLYRATDDLTQPVAVRVNHLGTLCFTDLLDDD